MIRASSWSRPGRSARGSSTSNGTRIDAGGIFRPHREARLVREFEVLVLDLLDPGVGLEASPMRPRSCPCR
jgi:hypothetical protein